MYGQYGIKGFYRGFLPSSIGVVPWVAINMTTFEFLKSFMEPWGMQSGYKNFLAGTISGTISMMAVFPIDLI
jgi:hypothetical protein